VTGFPRSPKLVRGGLVLLEPSSGALLRAIALQYNPDTLTRTLQVQGAGAQGDRLEALRLKGPPTETIKLEAEIDATDQLEHPDENASTVELGIHPQLAVLEALLYPPSGRLQTNATLASLGTLEIAPVEAPLTVFVWSRNRIVPVRVTEFSITEEAFDPALNPIRASVTLGMRVLSVDDLSPTHRGRSVFMAHLRSKEKLVSRSPAVTLSNLGIGGLP
jgi:hypothetical protein